MKNLYPLLILLFLSLSIYAQSPDKMSYQAVVRDANNTLVANQTVGMQISILQSTITGTVVYTETHSADTNINGLVSLEIGNGSSSDNFSEIDWSAGPYFIKTETDPTGGSSFTIIGTSQLMSVPYAMYAKSSGSSLPGPEGPAGFDGNSSSWKSLGTVGLPSAGIESGEFSLVYDPATWGDAGNTTHQLHISVNDTSANDFSQWFESVRPYDIVTIRSATNSAEAHNYEILPVTSTTASPPFQNNGPYTAFYGTTPNFFSARLRLINATSVPNSNGGPFAPTDPCYISFTKSGAAGPAGPAGAQGTAGQAGFDGNSSSWKSLGTVGIPPTGLQPGDFALVYDPGTWANAGNTTHQLHIGVDDAYGNSFVQWLKSVRPYDIITIRSVPNSPESHYYEVLPVTIPSASPPFQNNGPYTAFYGTSPNFFSARLRLINATSVPNLNGGPFAAGDLCHISFTKSGVDGLCNGFEGEYIGIGATLPISTPPTYGSVMFNSPFVGTVSKIIFYPEDVNQENLDDYFMSMNNFGYNGNRGLLTIASPANPNSNRYKLVYKVGSVYRITNSSGTAIQEIVVEVQFIGGTANANTTNIPFVSGKGLCYSFAPTGPAGLANAHLVTSAQPAGTTVPTTTVSYGEIEAIYFDVNRGSIVYQIGRSIPSFIELVVDPPGSRTNPTTQPRLTINDVRPFYPQ